MSQIMHFPPLAKHFSPFFKDVVLSTEDYFGKPKNPPPTWVESYSSHPAGKQIICPSYIHKSPGDYLLLYWLALLRPSGAGSPHVDVDVKPTERMILRHFTKTSLIFKGDMFLRDHSHTDCVSRMWPFLSGASHIFFTPQGSTKDTHMNRRTFPNVLHITLNGGRSWYNRTINNNIHDLLSSFQT